MACINAFWRFVFVMIQNMPQERIIMLGVIVNTAAVIAGSIIGLIIRKGIPQKWTDMIM